MNTSSYAEQPASPSPPQAAPVLQSQSLFRGQQEIVIRHDGHDYRLRITRQNKLILTK